MTLTRALLLSLICLAGLEYFHGYRASELLWADEIVTAELMNRSVSAIVSNRYWEGHSPVYFLSLKVWLQLASGLLGIEPQNESVLRFPSLLAAGAAGGFFASAAWRSWGALAAFFFVPLWSLNPLVGYYAVEARPYSLLLLALGLGVWSGTCLWTKAKEKSPGRVGLWALSTVSPIIATAIIPLGFVAIIAMEVSASTLIWNNNDSFSRKWKKRTLLVLFSGLVVLAVFTPGIISKSTNYWTDYVRPFGADSVGAAFAVVFLQKLGLAGWALVALAAAGFVLRRDQFLARVSAGLVLIYPIIIICLSAHASLLISRYFLPAIPGLFLLAAGTATPRLDDVRSVISTMMYAIVVATTIAYKPLIIRHYKDAVVQQLALIESQNITQLKGAVTHPNNAAMLRYYLGRRFGIVSELSAIYGPLKGSDLPESNQFFWLFDKKNGRGGRWIEGLTLLCKFPLQDTDVYVLAREPATPPLSSPACGTP